MQPIDEIVSSGRLKHFVEQRRRSIVIDYLIATSTHVLRSVGCTYSKLNQFFWICSFMITFDSMSDFVISSILQYYAYPTLTKFEIRLDRHMLLPSVKLSSNATFHQTILNSLYIPLIIDLFSRNQTNELLLENIKNSVYYR
ncbi:unnamed protein product [Adineta ricciae]|uniref:Uncharacterized protein n=1 Tax=Adineta ricciae TaxID=249248 RepID=A0A815MVB0_ADIRI|nr:unnamed protein product [Adineta ricciae]CAF1426486.1 unnamed protein product [Adineta ricciae]